MSKKQPGKVFNRGVAAKYFLPMGEAITVNGQSINVSQYDIDGNILFASGTATITDGAAGYAKGCLYIDTDVGAGSTGIYENVGTTTACNFDVIGAGGSGVTTFVALSDTPANYTAAANKLLKVNAGATAVEFVTVSGDVTMGETGAMTVTDLTITGETTNDLLYFDGTNWVRLATGADGNVIRSAAGVPTWVDPTTLPSGTASVLAQVTTIEAGANDIVVTTTTQTGGAGALGIPDFAGVADTFAFVTLAQTFANKTLTTPVIASFYQDAGKTKLMTTPDTASDTLCAIAATQTLTNKTIDCDGTGNVITNVNGDELDPVTIPVTETAVYGIPVVFMAHVSNEIAPVKITDSAPFKMVLIRAWSQNTSGDGGTWKLLDNASADMTDVVTAAASDNDIDNAGQIIDATSTISAGQDIYVDASATLDAYIFAEFLRVD